MLFGHLFSSSKYETLHLWFPHPLFIELPLQTLNAHTALFLYSTASGSPVGAFPTPHKLSGFTHALVFELQPHWDLEAPVCTLSVFQQGVSRLPNQLLFCFSTGQPVAVWEDLWNRNAVFPSVFSARTNTAVETEGVVRWSLSVWSKRRMRSIRSVKGQGGRRMIWAEVWGKPKVRPQIIWSFRIVLGWHLHGSPMWYFLTFAQNFRFKNQQIL